MTRNFATALWLPVLLVWALATIESATRAAERPNLVAILIHGPYDLQNDPDERRNLFRRPPPQQAEVLAGLRAKLQTWQESIDDPILKSGLAPCG